MTSPYDWQEVIGTVGLFVLLIAVVLSLIWRNAYLKRERMRHERDDRYLQLAEKVAEQNANLHDQLQAANERLARLETSSASIEQTLKVVE